MGLLRFIGSCIIELWRNSRNVAAVSTAVLTTALSPKSWTKAVRDVLGKQIIFTGVHALGLITIVGILAGLSVVAQVHRWLVKVGQSDLIGSVLAAIILREAGPLLVNFIVIARSGTAIATELAAMNINNELRVLESQGIDPLSYLVMPRAVGTALSVFALTIYFTTLSLITGMFYVILRGVTYKDIISFVSNILSGVSGSDIVNMVLKTLLCGFLTAIICCRAGVSGSGIVTDVPKAGTKGVVTALVALVVVSALISMASYV